MTAAEPLARGRARLRSARRCSRPASCLTTHDFPARRSPRPRHARPRGPDRRSSPRDRRRRQARARRRQRRRGHLPTDRKLRRRPGRHGAPGPRLAFIRGDTTSAVTLAQRAWTRRTRRGRDRAGLGWYAYLAGTMNARTGSPDAAADVVRHGAGGVAGQLPRPRRRRPGRTRPSVDTTPPSPATSKAIAIAPQPDALTALGDLLALGGDSEARRRAVRHGARRSRSSRPPVKHQVYNRQLVLFDVNHDRDLAAALTLAERELAERHDIYGYDAYAWALLANGRATDADAAMTKALAFGTRDAMLLYHAGEITPRARRRRSRAVAARAGARDPRRARPARGAARRGDPWRRLR